MLTFFNLIKLYASGGVNGIPLGFINNGLCMNELIFNDKIFVQEKEMESIFPNYDFKFETGILEAFQEPKI